MPIRFASLSYHPALPLIGLLVANVVFYLSLASAIA
jgi:hypothetical protein